MGNSRSVNLILDKHRKLAKNKSGDDSNSDLIFFNLPVNFKGFRSTKTYAEQICESTENELTNTEYNELYLHAHKIIITTNDVIRNVTNLHDRYRQLRIPEDNISLYVHFDFVENISGEKHDKLEELEELNELEKLKTHVENIKNYDNEINFLKFKIEQEKQSILDLKYVKSKLNKQIPNINEYIDTVKFLDNKYLK